MPLWEYKVITSGKGGFATPALLEKFLNDLGRDEWEIIHYTPQPDNPLSFTGLARRSTQRDWTLQDAAAAAAKAEAEKLRAEFEAKFKAATSNAPTATEEKAPSFLEEQLAPDDGFRKPVDTSRDDEPDAPEEEEKDDWEKLAEEDELPTFFDALKPHMRRNQRGPGMSVGTDYLAKKWGLAEEDIKGALVECGLQIPADENAKPVYVDYDGDLFWVNINRRGELWINTREKPRPVFRVVQGTKVASEAEETRPETGNRNAETGDRKAEGGEGVAEKREAKPAEKPVEKAPLPAGPDLLEKIRPHMRRNRRGPGGSGSTSFLARALRTTEAELMTAFAGLGLTISETAGAKPQFAEFGAELWWLNRDQRGGVWINGREKKPDETVASATAAEQKMEDAAPKPEAAVTAEAAPAASAETTAPGTSRPQADHVLPGVRLLLKAGKTGTFAGETGKLAGELGKSEEDFIATLVAVGLSVPEKAREKPVFVEHAGEIFWFNRNAKGQLWLNAKASKFADQGDDAGEGGEKSKRPRPRKKA
jgi:hypothetical protein